MATPTETNGRIRVGDRYLTLEEVRALAQQNGWADPTAFNTNNVESSFTNHNRSSYSAEEQLRMIDQSGWRSNNGEANVERVGPYYSQAETGDGTPIDEGGYRVNAGEVKGAKRYTRAKYKYDTKGNLNGVDFEADSKWYEDIAPLVSIGMMAAGAGGLLSQVGAGMNSTLGLGLGKAGEAVLGGATVGAGASALTHQNVLKGAALGAIGPAINAANPGASFAATPAGQAFVNRGLGMAARAVVSGRAPGPIGIATGILDAGGWK